MAESIRSGDLKLVGPPTDIPGVFHGPLYYYFLAPFKSLESAVLAVILVNLLSVIPFYLLAKDLFKSKFWALTAAVFFLVSFEATQYARWLSNPTLVVPAFSLYLLGLYRKNFILTAVGMGVAIQAQLFMLYLLPVTAIYFVFNKPKNLIIGSFIFLMFMSTFVLAELKFDFQGVKNLGKFFTEHNQSFNIVTRINNYSESIARVLQNNL